MKQTILTGFNAYAILSDGTIKNVSTGEIKSPNSKGKFTLTATDGTTTKTFTMSEVLADTTLTWTEPVEETAPKTAEELAAEAEEAKIMAELSSINEKNNAAEKVLQDSFNVALKVRSNETGEETEAVLTANRTAFLTAKKALADFVPEVSPMAEEIKEKVEAAEAILAKYEKLYALAIGKKARKSGGERSAATDAPVSGNFTLEVGNIKATATATATAFIVQSGSSVSAKIVDSAPRAVKTLRDTTTTDGRLKDGKTTKDISFSSWSAAASFVLGSSKSGKACWDLAETAK